MPFSYRFYALGGATPDRMVMMICDNPFLRYVLVCCSFLQYVREENNVLGLRKNRRTGRIPFVDPPLDNVARGFDLLVIRTQWAVDHDGRIILIL